MNEESETGKWLLWGDVWEKGCAIYNTDSVLNLD